jgi:hypothetical protein
MTVCMVDLPRDCSASSAQLQRTLLMFKYSLFYFMMYKKNM